MPVLPTFLSFSPLLCFPLGHTHKHMPCPHPVPPETPSCPLSAPTLIRAHRMYSHSGWSNPIMQCVLKQQCWQASSTPNLFSLPTNTQSSLSTVLYQTQLLLRLAVKTNTPYNAAYCGVSLKEEGKREIRTDDCPSLSRHY